MATVVEAGTIRIREGIIADRLADVSAERIPFPLGFDINIGKLRIGDILLAENPKLQAKLALLVIKGKGYEARGVPLFCLSSGGPIKDAKGVSIHDAGSVLKPMADLESVSIRLINTKGKKFIFPSQNKGDVTARVIRPATGHLAQTLKEYYKMNFYARNLRAISHLSWMPMLIKDLAGVIYFFQSGQAMTMPEILRDGSLVGTGGIIFQGSEYYKSQAMGLYREFTNRYIAKVAGRNEIMKAALEKAFGLMS